MNRYEYCNETEPVDGGKVFLEIPEGYAPPNIISLPDEDGMYEPFLLVGTPNE